MDHSGPPPDGASVRDANSVPDEVVCEEFVELITDYFEDALPPRKLSHVEEHLVLCDWCRTYLDQMQATIGALGALGERALAEPSESVLAALRNRRATNGDDRP
jgi:predicted anti-sigma-YlaC factor YlaD